ncbi:hypothetical protein Q3G72_020500 [Acer saccharum]|nr:hypothetical protein Q3G72_020500 [Acer saccharum]
MAGSAEDELSSDSLHMNKEMFLSERDNATEVEVIDSEEELVNAPIAVENELAGNVRGAREADNVEVGKSSRKKGKNNMGSFVKHMMQTRFSKLQCTEVDQVEVEVAKILETAAANGFDFNGVKKEVVEAIATREREDDDRF